MGLIRAAIDSIGGTFADQWIDFLTVPNGIPQTAAVFPAVQRGTNYGRGSNIRASEAVVSNGSQIVVPEGYGLLTLDGGEITSVVTQPGAYTWDSNSPEAKTVFTDGDVFAQLISQSWQRFKFGGRPSSQQTALFVSLKELPNNKFGTQTPIYWDDVYLNTQVGATARGTYTLRITNPILFARNLLPASYLQNHEVFDFTDPDNDVGTQLFNEVVASLAAAFSIYSNDPLKNNRISNLQRDSVGFSASLSSAVEEAFNWSTERGLQIAKVAILGIDYDEQTREILRSVQRADALAGSRGNSNLQASVAAGFESAGNTSGIPGLLGLGVAAGGMGIAGIQQTPNTLSTSRDTPDSASPAKEVNATESNLIAKLEQLKFAFGQGLITESEYSEAKQKLLGL